MFNITPRKDAVTPKERVRLTVVEASKKMGVSRPTIYKWCDRGKMPSHIFMGRLCIYLEDCVVPADPLTKGQLLNPKPKRKPKKKRRGRPAKPKKRGRPTNRVAKARKGYQKYIASKK